jgi:hypothetical protein
LRVELDVAEIPDKAIKDKKTTAKRARKAKYFSILTCFLKRINTLLAVPCHLLPTTANLTKRRNIALVVLDVELMRL